MCWEFVNPTQTPPAAPNDDLDFAPLAGLGQSKLATTPKSITPFAGIASFLAWLRQMGCYERLAQAMPFSHASPNAIPLADTLCAFLVSVIRGAARFAHWDWLRFPGKDAILRFFGRFTQGRIEACFRP